MYHSVQQRKSLVAKVWDSEVGGGGIWYARSRKKWERGTDQEHLSLTLSLKNRKAHNDNTLTFYGKKYVHTHTHTHTHAHTQSCTNGHAYTRRLHTDTSHTSDVYMLTPGSCGHEMTTKMCSSLSNLAHYRLSDSIRGWRNSAGRLVCMYVCMHAYIHTLVW